MLKVGLDFRAGAAYAVTPKVTAARVQLDYFTHFAQLHN